MRVSFEKGKGGRTCVWTATRTKGRVTTGTMGVGYRQLPHDLIQFIVESELGLTNGFWGSVAEGATFKSTNRKRTKPGRAVIRTNIPALDEAESVANRHYQAWRDGEHTPVGPTLDDMLQRWLALGEGETIDLDWR